MARALGPRAAWRQALLLLLVSGLVRAGQHFIRLALLAALGLAGLYMLHMLAQDYNKITSRPGRPAVAATRALFRAITKRDVSQAQAQAQDAGPQSARDYAGQLLKQVVMQDPLGCARKLVCQLSASSHLLPHEAAILRLVRRKERHQDGDGDLGAAAEFRAAQELGKSGQSDARCAAHYSKCLIEPRTFLKLLQAMA